MGSVAAPDVTLDDTPDSHTAQDVVPKLEPDQDGYDSPSGSEISIDAEQDLEPVAEKSLADPPRPPKRKGGRKPIYATSEERKQRNRQAQAAFRERRTEYIKQLEQTIQQHEENLQSLQQSHRQAADECLMLRYKNSLLERILLEKGIDVQAELALKSSPHLRPVRGPNLGQPSPMQRAMLNRQQRQRPVPAPPIQTVNAPPRSSGQRNFAGSPTLQPTPPSQHSSPSTTKSPFAMQGGMTSPMSDLPPQQLQQPYQAMQRPLQQVPHQQFAPQPRTRMRNMSSANNQQPIQPARPQEPQSTYYSNSFPKHYDQLEQEYDAQPDILDDVDLDGDDIDNFIPNFRLPSTTNPTSAGMQASPPMTTSGASDGGGMGVHSIDPYDPMLDADPFGLTASMHFPNPFNFQPQQRR